MLLDLLGHQKVVDEISRADVREVRNLLMKLPPNATKRFPDIGLKQVAQIAEKNGLEPMSPKSVGLYVEALSAYSVGSARFHASTGGGDSASAASRTVLSQRRPPA